MLISQMDLVKQKLAIAGKLNTSEVIKQILKDDKESPRKQFMFVAEDYYLGDHDINAVDFRKAFIYETENGEEVEKEISNRNNSNHHNVHNFYQQQIDQKVAYISGKPPTFTVEGAENNTALKTYEDLITAVTTDEEFLDTLNDYQTNASNTAVAWLHVYYDNSGEFKFVLIPAQEIIEFYDGRYQKDLSEVIRAYTTYVVRGNDTVERKKVEWWDKEKVTYYVQDDNNNFVLDKTVYPNPSSHWYSLTSIDGAVTKTEPQSWGRVPFIPLYNNSAKISDLKRVKSLIDAYNLLSSSSTNNQIDLVELYWMIQGYDGEAAKTIAKKLQINKSVSISDPNGRVSAEQAVLNTSERIEWLKVLRKDIYHLGMAIDVDMTNFGSAPSGVSLKFQYTLLDMKANQLIVKLKKALKEFFWYLTEDINRKNGTDYDSALVRVDFQKSLITNDAETVDMINTSRGLVPDTILLAKHPLVDDANQALADLEKQKQDNAKTMASEFGFDGNKDDAPAE